MKISDSSIVAEALKVLESSFAERVCSFDTSSAAKEYIKLQIAFSCEEKFAVAFLDTRLNLIEFRVMFCGTINEAVTYLRPIVRVALELGAANVIFAHNHPSGHTKPSDADLAMTRDYSKILNALNIKVIDHLIVGPTESFSFAENNCMS